MSSMINEGTKLQQYLAEKRGIIENALLVWMEGLQAPEELKAAMSYSLLAGGKRLRPILVLASAELVGGRELDVLPAACGVEMIHTYSLIHDDLPLMDNDDFRRGKPTNHRVFGEATALLAGDGLLTLAFEAIATSHSPAERIVKAVRELAVGAGAVGMVGGQTLDLASEGKTPSLVQLQRIHTAKTGELIRAALRIGVGLAGGGEVELKAIGRYADGFGLAFQITDDILDVVGNADVMGKPIGSDARQEKATYPRLVGLDDSRRLAIQAISDAEDALSVFGNQAWVLKGLVGALLSREK